MFGLFRLEFTGEYLGEFPNREQNKMESTEQVPDVSRENKPIKEGKTKKKSTETGIIYLSRIPPLMNVKKIRDIFSEYGEIGRIFLQPDGKNFMNVVEISRYSRGILFEWTLYYSMLSSLVAKSNLLHIT